jgi:hypothetical protein
MINPLGINMRIFCFMTLLTLPLFSSCNEEEKNLLPTTQEFTMTEASSQRLESVLPADLFHVLKFCTKAVYYPVKADLSNPQKSYEPLDHALELPASIFKPMQALLLNDNTYMFDAKKKCLFIPNLALELKLNDEKLTILIGIRCKQVQFIYGKENIILDVDPAFPEIEELLNSLRRKKQ